MFQEVLTFVGRVYLKNVAIGNIFFFIPQVGAAAQRLFRPACFLPLRHA